MRAVLNAISIFAMLLLIGCAKDTATNPSEGEGEIRMYMVDSPSAAEEVVVVVNRVEVHTTGSDSTSGWIVVNDTPASYDLLKLRNGASVILGSSKLKVGRYTQIRLILGTGSYVKISGTKYDLEVSSGFQTGVKLNHTFEIEADNVYELYLDFDADRSVRASGMGQYRLVPVIRVQTAVTSGSISGTIAPANAGAYIWTTVGPDTVSTYAATDGSFKLIALPEGMYTVTIESMNSAYLGTTVSGVIVTRQQTTSMGTITLSIR